MHDRHYEYYEAIRGDSGALVMPAEIALNNHSIEILIKFNELNCVKDKADVYK